MNIRFAGEMELSSGGFSGEMGNGVGVGLTRRIEKVGRGEMNSNREMGIRFSQERLKW